MKHQATKPQHYAFTQTKHSPLLAKDAVAHGTLTIKGPAQMRWQYTDPTDFTLVIDTDTIYTIQQGRRTPLGGMAGTQMRAMAQTMMSLGSGEALSNGKLFDVQLSDSPAAIQATLIPKRRDMRRAVEQIIVHFDRKDYQVRTVKLLEKKDSYTLIEFRSK